MLRAFPLVYYVRDALHADDVLTEHSEDGVVGGAVVQWNAPVVSKPLVLPDALFLQGLHDLGHEARQFTLGLHRVFPPYDVVADECDVVTDDDTASEGDSDREALVMAVAQAHRVRVVPVVAT